MSNILGPQTIATVFGGTGFIGRQVVRELARLGVRIKIATRTPQKAYFLRPCGVVGQIVPVQCDVNDDDSLSEAIKGSDIVVNTIGILFERQKGAFQKIHAELPGRIGRIAKEAGVKRLVHISALACERGDSNYAKSKQAGEEALLKAFSKATILRPSIVFGPDDDFFNKFANMALVLPVLPLIGGGHTKFQPVYVGDVADAVLKSLTLPDIGELSPCGQTYELAGPQTLTFKELLERLLKEIQRDRKLLPLPWGIANIQAAFFSLMPTPLLTRDQVKSLKTDNVLSGQKPTLEALGVTPEGLDLILPGYLEKYRPGGRFAPTNKAA